MKAHCYNCSDIGHRLGHLTFQRVKPAPMKNRENKVPLSIACPIRNSCETVLVPIVGKRWNIAPTGIERHYKPARVLTLDEADTVDLRGQYASLFARKLVEDRSEDCVLSGIESNGSAIDAGANTAKDRSQHE